MLCESLRRLYELLALPHGAFLHCRCLVSTRCIICPLGFQPWNKRIQPWSQQPLVLLMCCRSGPKQIIFYLRRVLSLICLKPLDTAVAEWNLHPFFFLFLNLVEKWSKAQLRHGHGLPQPRRRLSSCNVDPRAAAATRRNEMRHGGAIQPLCSCRPSSRGHIVR